MSQAVGSKVLVVTHGDNPPYNAAAVMSSLRSCGLAPIEFRAEEGPWDDEMRKLRDFACVVYVGSEYEVSTSRIGRIGRELES